MDYLLYGLPVVCRASLITSMNDGSFPEINMDTLNIFAASLRIK